MPSLLIARAVPAVAVLALALACNSASDPDIGSLKVSVVTTGVNPDPDGYSIKVQDRSGEAVGVNGSVTISELPPGNYPVTISGLASNCFLDGPGTVTLLVKAGETATATFSVSCPAATAYVRVTTQTTGLDQDPNGYLVQVGTAPPRRVTVQGVINLSSPEEGTVPIAMSDLAANCTADAGNPATISVVAGQANPVTLKVACAATSGSIAVTVATSGADVQTGGFTVTVDAATVTLDATNKGEIRVPAGAHNVELDTYSLLPNCRVTSSNPQQVVVEVGGVTPATILVNCVALSRVTASVTTTGPDADSDGYLVSLSSGGYYTPGYTYSFAVAANGSTSYTAGIQPGSYQVYVGGIAVNCRLSSATPNPLVVAAGTATLTIAVECLTGSQFAFVLGTGAASEIYLGSTTGGAQRLSTNAVADSNPAWSPDGTRIAFTSTRDGNNEIYTMNADGSDVRRLTSNQAADYQPTWSPDGTRIAFVSQRNDVAGDIYVMATDGSNPQRITTDPHYDAEPAWSPNGSQILFVSQRSGAKSIHVMNPDGSGVIQLTSTDPTLPDQNPAWSPNGTQIAFSRGVQLYTMNANGSLLAPRNAYLYAFSGISWGAGDQIAFATQRCNDDYYGCYYVTTSGIDLLRPDGSVVNLGGTGSTEPAWKP